jgi:hypothetical protein
VLPAFYFKAIIEELANLFHSISEIESAPSFKVESYLENNFPKFPQIFRMGDSTCTDETSTQELSWRRPNSRFNLA